MLTRYAHIAESTARVPALTTPTASSLPACPALAFPFRCAIRMRSSGGAGFRAGRRLFAVCCLRAHAYADSEALPSARFRTWQSHAAAGTLLARGRRACWAARAALHAAARAHVQQLTHACAPQVGGASAFRCEMCARVRTRARVCVCGVCMCVRIYNTYAALSNDKPGQARLPPFDSSLN